MEEFLRYTLLLLVDHPEEIRLVKNETEQRTDFRLSVAKADIPKVLGRGGHTIQAIRSLLNASAQRHGKRATLELVEP